MTLTAPLYMLRHGETAWNTERRMQGSKNSDLTERGRAQALAMGRTLTAELARAPGPTIFLRSPLGRVRETSQIVGRELGLDAGEWRDDPRLAELSYGQWEGSSWKEIEVDASRGARRLARRPGRLFAAGRRDPFRVAPALGGGAGRYHRVEDAHRRGRPRRQRRRPARPQPRPRCRAMFVLEKPQDAFFRLLAGVEERISCG